MADGSEQFKGFPADQTAGGDGTNDHEGLVKTHEPGRVQWDSVEEELYELQG